MATIRPVGKESATILNKQSFTDDLKTHREDTSLSTELRIWVQENLPMLNEALEGVSSSTSSLNFIRYAKGSLEIIKKYNEYKKQVIAKSKYLKDYLHYKRLDIAIEEARNGKLEITIPEAERPAVLRGLGELQALRAELNLFMDEQVLIIVKHLKELPQEDRIRSHRQIISAFMTLSGYDSLFTDKDERAEFAISFSNKIAQGLTRYETDSILEDVSANHNFIRLNQRLGKLAEAIEALFYVDHELSITLVAEFLKEAIERKSGTLANYCSSQQGLLNLVTDEDLKDAIKSTEKKYQNFMQMLVEKRDDVCKDATNKDADAIEKLNRALKALRQQEQKLITKQLAPVEKEQAKLQRKMESLQKKKQAIRLIPAASKLELTKKKARIAQVEAEIQALAKKEVKLAENRKKVRAEINAIVSKIGKMIEEINKVKHGINFDGPEFDKLRTDANKALEEDRQLREDETNLQYQNRRSFRVFSHFMKGVDTKKTPVEQRLTVAARAKVLTDKTANYFWVLGKVQGVWNWITGYDKVTKISIADLAQKLHTPPSEVEFAYRGMNEKQKDHYKKEMKHVLGFDPAFLKA